MGKIIVTAEIWKEGDMFTAYCPELDVASCGHSPDGAKKNLSDVIGIQLEETSKLGTLKDFLADAGQDIRKIWVYFYQTERLAGYTAQMF
jgi:predicted RNase H-like HicB family nuclease